MNWDTDLHIQSDENRVEVQDRVCHRRCGGGTPWSVKREGALEGGENFLDGIEHHCEWVIGLEAVVEDEGGFFRSAVVFEE